jgi:hypothetical protein
MKKLLYLLRATFLSLVLKAQLDPHQSIPNLVVKKLRNLDTIRVAVWKTKFSARELYFT